MEANESEAFFCSNGIVNSCNDGYEPITQIFRTLLLERDFKQQNLADGVGIDKANISRICNGLYIPDLNMRLKIAKFLGVDSSLIWRAKDIENIRKILWEQTKSNSSNNKPLGIKEEEDAVGLNSPASLNDNENDLGVEK